MRRGRRSSSFAGSGRSVLLPNTSRGGRRRGRRGRSTFSGGRSAPPRRPAGGRPLVPAVIGLVALAALGLAIAFGLSAVHDSGKGDRRDAAARFAAAYAKADRAGMWRALSPDARRRYSEARFAELYQQVERTAGVATVRTAPLGAEHDGSVTLPVAATTRRFGTLRGTLTLAVSGKGKSAGVDWTPAARLPGLRSRERVTVDAGPAPTPGRLLAADGSELDATGLGASIAGEAASGKQKATGLRRVHAATLEGHASATLKFGERRVRRISRQAGRSVQTTIRPGLTKTAAAALGGKLGGVAVIRPSDGAVQALAGIAVSAPQPPGSTFKIITLSAALASGKATPSSSYPNATYATLAGTKLRNASSESCGGPLPQAFADSCNSVFAPLGAKVGAKRLVSTAEAFGFNERLTQIPAVKASTIPAASALKDDLAVGASAIGQDRDLATPLEMATVGATIANGGRRVRPRLATSDAKVARRVVSSKVAGAVRTMMLGVVRSGTGTAAAIPGVEVAGKTGTAELRPSAGNADPANTDAWFVAFAPASRPKAAVAVLLVGAGAGGAAAAPIAKQVLEAALG